MIISYYYLGKNINWVEAATGGFFADNLYIVTLIGVKFEKDFGHVSFCSCDDCTDVSIFLKLFLEELFWHFF